MPETDLIDRLIALRHEAGLSQATLASKLNITGASVTLYEKRRRRVPIAMARRWVAACGKEFHEVIVAPGQFPEGALGPDEGNLVRLYRKLAPDDRALVTDLARGLDGGSIQFRESIAALVPLLLKSAPSDENREADSGAKRKPKYETGP